MSSPATVLRNCASACTRSGLRSNNSEGKPGCTCGTTILASVCPAMSKPCTPRPLSKASEARAARSLCSRLLSEARSRCSAICCCNASIGTATPAATRALAISAMASALATFWRAAVVLSRISSS